MGQIEERPANDPADQRADLVQLAWDQKAWEAVSAAGFSGPLYDRLVDRMIRYALPRIRAVIRCQQIFIWCHERNHKIKLSAPSRWTDADQEDLAVRSVAKAAERFDRTAGTRRGWSPSGGATLATFFTGMCIDEFPNQFRSWCGAQKKLQHEVPVGEPVRCLWWLRRRSARVGVRGADARPGDAMRPVGVPGTIPSGR